jgi:hypothetical protein
MALRREFPYEGPPRVVFGSLNRELMDSSPIMTPRVGVTASKIVAGCGFENGINKVPELPGGGGGHGFGGPFHNGEAYYQCPPPPPRGPPRVRGLQQQFEIEINC